MNLLYVNYFLFFFPHNTLGFFLCFFKELDYGYFAGEAERSGFQRSYGLNEFNIKKNRYNVIPCMFISIIFSYFFLKLLFYNLANYL